jgi:uncharacterized membrane protein YhaH (DUF805 family)
MEWMLMPLRRYADFSGRSRRKEYWMFTLGVTILYVILVLLFWGTGGLSDPANPGELSLVPLLIICVVALALFIPSLAVTVRRFHDQDKSGWYILLGFIPYVGSLILLVFMCLDGTRGENRFGPDPKGPDHGQVFA